MTFDAKTSEGYELSRDVAEAALETGYKIADGIVTNQPEISFEGIVTSVYQTGLSGRRAWDSVAAAAAVANMQARGILFGVRFQTINNSPALPLPLPLLFCPC
ncbi:phage baseplate protein [Citrobacter gillenii]